MTDASEETSDITESRNSLADRVAMIFAGVPEDGVSSKNIANFEMGIQTNHGGVSDSRIRRRSVGFKDSGTQTKSENPTLIELAAKRNAMAAAQPGPGGVGSSRIRRVGFKDRERRQEPRLPKLVIEKRRKKVVISQKKECKKKKAAGKPLSKECKKVLKKKKK